MRGFSEGFRPPTKINLKEALVPLDSVAVNPASANYARCVVADAQFVYVGIGTAKTIAKYTRDLKTLVATSPVLTNQPEFLEQDDEYVYCISNVYVSKFRKSNMTIVDAEYSTTYTGFRSGFLLHGDSLYVSNVDYIMKINKNTLVGEATSPVETAQSCGAIATDGMFLYSAGADNILRKRSLTTLVVQASSAALTAQVISLACRLGDIYGYTGGQSSHSIKKIKLSDLTVDQTIAWLTNPTINRLQIVGDYLYFLDTTGELYKVDLKDLSKYNLKSAKLATDTVANGVIYKIGRDIYTCHKNMLFRYNEAFYK